MPLRSEMVERLARVLARSYAHDEEKWRGYVSTARTAVAEMLPLAEVTIATGEAELTRYEAARLYEWAIGDGTREAPADRHTLAAVGRGLRFLVDLAGDELPWTPVGEGGVDVVSAALPEVWVDGVPRSYDSFEAIYDAGWRVD